MSGVRNEEHALADTATGAQGKAQNAQDRVTLLDAHTANMLDALDASLKASTSAQEAEDRVEAQLRQFPLVLVSRSTIVQLQTALLPDLLHKWGEMSARVGPKECQIQRNHRHSMRPDVFAVSPFAVVRVCLVMAVPRKAHAMGKTCRRPQARRTPRRGCGTSRWRRRTRC